MLNEDNAEYLQFTTKSRLDKAMHTLEGIVQGIAIDKEVNAMELRGLAEWIKEHLEYRRRHPFNEIIDRINEILNDGIVDAEERADMLWLCKKFQTDNVFFDEVTSDMQRLQGLVAGVASDRKITEAELLGMREWMGNHTHLRTCWPYDELDSLIMTVMADGKIDDNEHDMLLSFFDDFRNVSASRTVQSKDNGSNSLVSGVCAVCPEVDFAGRKFCFTGTSERLTRKELALQVVSLGGEFSPRVTQKLNYLVIGGVGNQCWTYSCYGRKVEQAVDLRKRGIPVLIVHENDYWDAFEDNC